MQVRKKALCLTNNSPDLKADASQQVNKNYEIDNSQIDNSQMRCKRFTRYKSNPIYEIS